MPGAEEIDARAAREGPGIFSNSIVNIVGVVAVGVMGALGGLITARTLGREGVGILAVTWGFIEFGRAVTACTHVPSILWYHKGRSAGLVFGTSLLVKGTLSAAFVGAIVLLAPLLEATFDIPRVAVMVASSVLLIGSLFEVGAARLEADNRMVKSNVVLASGSVLGLAALVALAVAGDLTVMTSIFTTLLANATMTVGALFVAMRGLRMRIDTRLGVEMTTYGLRIVAAALLTQGLLWTDTLMVSYLRGNESAGVYQVVFLLTHVMVSASTAMGVALVPALSDLVGRGQDTSAGYHRGTLVALVIGVSVASVYLVGGHWILLLYGDGFTEGYVPLLVLTLFGVAASLGVPATTMLTVHGHAAILTRLSLAQLVVNIPLNYFLIQRMGILGAAIATASVFTLGTLTAWWLVRRATGAWPLSQSVVKEGRDFVLTTLRLKRGA